MRKAITAEQIKELASLVDSSTRLFTRADGEEYDKLIARWADNAVKQAGVVAVPVQYEEVAKLVKFAADRHIDLAVRGGGHSTGGTSSTEGGLSLDLSSMRDVRIDTASKHIIAQGGAMWADVDNAAIEKGLATVGGTVNHTGIGGLSLGGGFGWLAGMYGCVVDNIVAAKVVIADGRLLSVSEKENADLFWAIRGAGHNFGVVVEFTFQGHDQTNEVYAGSVVFTADKLLAIVETLNKLMESGDAKGAAILVFARPPTAPAPVVVTNVFYNGDQAAAEEYFKLLFDLGPVANMAKMMPYNHVNGLLNAMATHGRRKSIKAVTLTNNVEPAFIQELFNDYVKVTGDNSDLAHTFVGMEFYNLEKLNSIPIEAMAFANRGPYRAGVVGLEWTNDKMDEENRDWGRMIQAKCRQKIINSKEYSPETTKTALEYANYLEPGDLMGDKPFGVNQRRLAVLKQKYDPGCVFYKTSPIAPLVTARN
ncbi:FAD-binding domain-containing protein [Trichoderma citrinoviride]|uniref:FAD-binding domain-containing protein n=1 Tax=Trichoderma citrinoviride TaxID=58853 RepID=A0A2T4AZN5_9HYPO|nr:FAD-binding domain-containing protein [Trichoderma citrinoviride]PTB62535.1 FAD-binding domain-containing protein [Trichoderma citrinoviride]